MKKQCEVASSKNIIKVLYLLITSTVFISCSTFITSDPEVTFVNNNVLLPKISFQTKDSLSVYIEYWQIDNEEKRTSTMSHGVHHEIGLFNFIQDMDYQYVIRSSDKSYESDVFQFRTGIVPEDIIVIKKEKIDTSVFKGYVLLRKYEKSGADVLLNNKGDVVWYHHYDTAIRRQFYWTKNNTILSGVDTAHIVEVDLSGKRLLDIDLIEIGNPHFLHHEIVYDKDGNIVTLTSDSLYIESNMVKGMEGRYVYVDGILKLSPEGKTLWKWNVNDHIDFATMIKSLSSMKFRISHCNALAIDSDGNYLVSFRHHAQVWKINSETGDVMWKLGKGGDVKMDTSAYFIGQHSVNSINGKVLLFDNGLPNSRPYSRILEFSVDEQTKVAKTETLIDLPQSLTSYRMGSAYQIEDEKYLVCTSRKPMQLSVVNKKGEILWMVGSDDISYRAYYIENPFLIQQK